MSLVNVFREEEDSGEKVETIMDQIENCLAQSLLIFMLADLRLLSATGRISTKYETLSIDSDRVMKTSANEITCLSDPRTNHRVGSSISPAHIMTVLFIEIMNEVQVHKGKINIPADGSGNFLQEETDTFEDPNRLLSIDTGYLQRNAMLKQAEGDMHDLIRGYARGLRRDLKQDLAEVEKAARSTPHMKIKDKIKELKVHFQKPQIKRMRAKSQLETMHEFVGIQNSLLNSAGGAALENMHSSLGDAVGRASFRSSVVGAIDDDESMVDHDKDLLRRMMEVAVESREFDQLHFVKDFFKEGSISHVMAKSTAQLVWLHDWFPTKECTYAISVDVIRKKVLVVFRGAITRQDWSHAFDSNLREVPNPITEEYEGKIPNVRLHHGFYRYLFRERKDTRTTKYDEISEKVHQYGMHMIGDEYQVTVTGHSLGGALATLFSFYASCDERFTRNAPIQVVTFGCPYICGYSMAHAIRHQEDVDKFRYVRVHNVRDGIPHLPPVIFQFTKYGALYHHVGIDVTLPMIRKNLLKVLPDRQATVSYTRELLPIFSWLRQARDYYFWSTPFRPWKISLMHTLVEHQERLLKIQEKNTPLIYMNLDKVYEIVRSQKRKFWHANRVA